MRVLPAFNCITVQVLMLFTAHSVSTLHLARVRVCLRKAFIFRGAALTSAVEFGCQIHNARWLGLFALQGLSIEVLSGGLHVL